jgi:N-methylhydantoinase B
VSAPNLRESYIPPTTITTPNVAMHDTWDDADLDPITYEILRHSLRMANEESGQVIIRTSGSPVVVHGRDFNTALLTHTGEYVFYGPYTVTHAGSIELAVKWVLEHRSDSPGIGPGDMWMTNDPWVSVGHANDIVMAAPIFHEGELFCWVANELHHIDVGGQSAGGRVLNARDAYAEPNIFPPIRIVEDGRIRDDLFDMFIRRSRLPDYSALDLRAQVAGNHAAAAYIQKLVDRYGPSKVKGAMMRVIDDAESVVRARLLRLADGTWYDRTYVDGKRAGDREVYTVGLTMEKRGDELIMRDHGSSPQLDAPINCVYASWRSGMLCVLLGGLASGHGLMPGGVLRCVTFEPTPGTIVNARFPAPVNRGGSQVGQLTMGLTQSCLSRLLVTSEADRRFIMSVSGVEPILTLGVTGKNLAGSRYMRVYTDGMGAGSQATTLADGVATGGGITTPDGPIPNVEDIEVHGEQLYLFRRELPDSGGPGKHRGGNTLTFATIPIDVEFQHVDIFGTAFAMPAFTGLFGGYPGHGRHVLAKRDTDLSRMIEAGRLPADLSDVGDGPIEILPSKCSELEQGPNDMIQVVQGGATGIGDPIDRDTASVASDVEGGAISLTHAAIMFGVVFDSDGVVDHEKTLSARFEIRRRRLGKDPVGVSYPLEVEEPRVGLDLVVADGRIVCRACGHELCGLNENYRLVCATSARSISAIGNGHLDPSNFIDAEMEFREYACPSCATLFATEVSLASEEPLREFVDVSWPLGISTSKGTKQ